jgi:hypothetical protein
MQWNEWVGLFGLFNILFLLVDYSFLLVGLVSVVYGGALVSAFFLVCRPARLLKFSLSSCFFFFPWWRVNS